MTFTITEQAVIRAVKTNLEAFIYTKNMFWNGVTDDCVIAGGVFASLVSQEDFKDIDVFILNKNVSVYAHLTDSPSSKDQWAIRDSGAGGYLQNPHIHGVATNLSTKVQYILTDYTSREELLKSFDYKHCTISYVPKEGKLYVTRGAFDAIRNKELIVNGDKEPKLWRKAKFENRGWRHTHTAEEHHQGLADSFQQTIQQSVAEMLMRVNKQKGNLPILNEKDIDIEAFKALLK